MLFAGQEVLLTFASFQYAVVIEEFVCDLMQTYEIPYRIKCYITQVTTAAVQPSLDDLILDDLTSLTGQAGQFDSNAASLSGDLGAL